MLILGTLEGLGGKRGGSQLPALHPSTSRGQPRSHGTGCRGGAARQTWSSRKIQMQVEQHPGEGEGKRERKPAPARKPLLRVSPLSCSSVGPHCVGSAKAGERPSPTAWTLPTSLPLPQHPVAAEPRFWLVSCRCWGISVCR